MAGVSKTYDPDLLLKDDGAVTASAAAQVDSSDKILDLGSGLVEGDIIIDVSACELDTQDEKYVISAQISNSDDFSEDNYEMMAVPLGSAGVNLFTEIDLISGYTSHKETPVAGVNAISGYATIGNSAGTLDYPSATVPGITSATYDLDITIDGGSNLQLAIALLDTDTWAQIAGKIQVALRAADGAKLHTVAINGNFIRVTSVSTGTSSTVLIAAGTAGSGGGDLLTAIDAISGYTPTLPTPVAGINATAGYAEISNSGSLGAFTGATVPGIRTRDYNVDITIDGGSALKLVVALTELMTWTQICAAIQVALRAADSGNLHTVAIVGNNIRVTSVSTGASSAVLVANGTFGAGGLIFGDVDLGVGRYIIPFNNIALNGEIKRYLRLYHTITGTVTTGINYTAYLAKR
jgi:hypothetical protein